MSKPLAWQIKLMKKLVKDWAPLLFLSDWRIAVKYLPVSERPAGDTEVAKVRSNKQIRSATIILWNDPDKEFSYDRPREVKIAVYHELCHLVITPLIGDRNPQLVMLIEWAVLGLEKWGATMLDTIDALKEENKKLKAKLKK